MRVAIIGSRAYPRLVLVRHYIEMLDPQGDIVITGCARGVDATARALAQERGIHVAKIEALWYTHHRAAGPIRNRWIVLLAERVVAFWDGKSDGTRSILKIASEHNRPVTLFDVEGVRREC